MDIQQTLSASGLVHTGQGILSGLVVSNSAASTSSVIVYDNTSGSGTIIFQASVAPGTSAAPLTMFFPDRFAPRFQTGLYVTLGGLGLVANIWGVGY